VLGGYGKTADFELALHLSGSSGRLRALRGGLGEEDWIEVVEGAAHDAASAGFAEEQVQLAADGPQAEDAGELSAGAEGQALGAACALPQACTVDATQAANSTSPMQVAQRMAPRSSRGEVAPPHGGSKGGAALGGSRGGSSEPDVRAQEASSKSHTQQDSWAYCHEKVDAASRCVCVFWRQARCPVPS